MTKEMFWIASQSVFQLLQEEMGVMKCYNLKPGGDKILVSRQNRKGESSSHKGWSQPETHDGANARWKTVDKNSLYLHETFQLIHISL